MSIKNRSRIIVFILAWLVWFALTDIKDYQEVIAGFVIALLVSLIAGHLLITTEKSTHFLKRMASAVIYFLNFIWEMVKANIHVAYIVINPNLPIKPCIVKVKTNLTKDSAITILSNSITLTPGTLTIDINKDKNELYVHCIDTESTDTDEATESIGGRFEKQLTEVFE